VPTIKQLNQRHDSCDIEEILRLRALYEGGKAFRKMLGVFLPKRPAEPLQRWVMRKEEAHYQNYIGPIVDFFAAMLFTSRPVPVARRDGSEDNETDPGEYYNLLRGNCDRTGTDIDTFFHEQLVEAMVSKVAWHRIHQPTSGTRAPTNRAEFDQFKLGDCWLEALPSEDVLDWETDDSGNLEWVLIHSISSRRDGPGGDRSQVTETWESVTANSVETFQIRYPKDNPPPDSTDVPVVAREPHTFGRVPVMCIELPAGLWVTNRLESPQLAHFRASNAQDWGMAQTCYAMPVYKVDDPEEFNLRMGAGYGLTIKPTEDVEWTAPPGEHFAALEERIKTHKDEIFRIGHQMALGVENNSAAVGRTAESKMADAQITRVVLIAFAKAVKEAMGRTYDAISAARGDKFKWAIGGLDEFASTDLQSFLMALTEVKDFGTIPSRTAMVEIWNKAVDALLPELDQKTKSAIREEIKDGTLDPADELDPDAQLHALAAGLTGTPNAKPSGARGAGRGKPAQAPGGGSGSTSPPAA
jgi:hypothetical protein